MLGERIRLPPQPKKWQVLQAMKNFIEPDEALSRIRSFSNKTRSPDDELSKVPAVTLGFWIIKVAATTLGETGGDSVTMTLDWGYLAGTALFLALLVILVLLQILTKRFHPLLYWATIVASTTFGTTMADFADRSLGIGYTGGSALLLLCLFAVLGSWYWRSGQFPLTPSIPQKSKYSTGPQSRFPKLWAPRWAIGLLTPVALDTKAALSSSQAALRLLPDSTSGVVFRALRFFGLPSF
jgi:hypothetical protein